MADHTLQIGGTTKALRMWGITMCRGRWAVGGDDSLSFEVPARLDVEFPLVLEIGSIARGTPVVLRDPSSVVRFRGVLLEPQDSATGRSERVSYQAIGGNWRLKEITYKQAWVFALDAATVTANIAAIRAAMPTTGVPAGAAWNAAFETAYTGRIILNRTNAGVFLSVKDQVAAILAYANAPQSPDTGAGLTLTYGLGVASTAALPTLVPPVSQELDLSCVEAIRRQLAWVPAYDYRFDYTATEQRPIFGDVTTGTTFGVPRVLDLNAANATVEFLGEPMWGLLVKQVEVTYLYGNTAIDPDNVSTYFNVALRARFLSTAAANGSDAVIVNTVVLNGAIVPDATGGMVTTEGEPVPDANDLAEELHKPYRRPYFRLTWTQKELEVDWSIVPGVRWSVSGASAKYADCESVCQVVMRDIMAGTTRVECGPPQQLGLGQLMDLKRANRMKRQATGTSEQQYGTTGDKKKSPTGGGGGGIPAGYVETNFKMCNEATGEVVVGQILFKPA